MLPPATLAALHRLVAILLALVDALASPVDGAHRPLVTRLAARAFSAYLERLAADLTEMDGNITAKPNPTRARRLRVRHTPLAPRITHLPSPPAPETNPLHTKIGRPSQPSQHA